MVDHAASYAFLPPDDEAEAKEEADDDAVAPLPARAEAEARGADFAEGADLDQIQI